MRQQDPAYLCTLLWSKLMNEQALRDREQFRQNDKDFAFRGRFVFRETVTNECTKDVVPQAKL